MSPQMWLFAVGVGMWQDQVESVIPLRPKTVAL